MNNFKKFVAVLLGVVMACVFATSAFAASTADKADAIKSEMANYGLTGFDAVIDSLNDTQLQVLIDNRGTLEEKASQVIAYKNDNHPAERSGCQPEQPAELCPGHPVSGRHHRYHECFRQRQHRHGCSCCQDCYG